ncbi:hypothetical protein L1987_50949 [Smallanthus sonchifolius]|uniref:Uncharacterized protein n=1 Tax=Smallanthus sonchifolius TaxID=185202 RepID=A0ACB9ENB6_9ASTR|nr:hypothetical protein L1987_50949 [Smallanthus sonchifolius]
MSMEHHKKMIKAELPLSLIESNILPRLPAKLDSWRQIELSVYSKTSRSWSPATLCDQCLYFTVTYLTGVRNVYSKIICFDVKTETFREIRFPPLPLDARDREFEARRSVEDGWVKVASFSDPLYEEFRRQHICRECIGYWLAIFEESNCFEKMNVDDLGRHCWYFCSRAWEYRSSRMMYCIGGSVIGELLLDC